MTQAQIELIRDAMHALENMPCGGIGKDGYTLAEIDAADEQGRPLDDDAAFHQTQRAYRLLEQALDFKMVKP